MLAELIIAIINTLVAIILPINIIVTFIVTIHTIHTISILVDIARIILHMNIGMVVIIVQVVMFMKYLMLIAIILQDIMRLTLIIINNDIELQLIKEYINIALAKC
jgi:hypothetical protein